MFHTVTLAEDQVLHVDHKDRIAHWQLNYVLGRVLRVPPEEQNSKKVLFGIGTCSLSIAFI